MVASNVLTLNQWQYFAVTMTATGSVQIYKNGVPVGSGQTNVPNNVTRANAFLVTDAGRAEYARGELIRVLLK